MKNLTTKTADIRFPLLLAGLTLVMLAAMELRHPYFFLQDDNRTFHLPYYVHNLKALAGGELPLFNFNQYLGTPVSFLSAPFYPVTYIAMLLSRLFLGHYFGVMEFVAAIHLPVAALGFYRFSRDFGLEKPSCFFGAVAWAFAPFVITIGNSWIHTLGYAAYLPWILCFSIRQLDGFSLRGAANLLLVRFLAFLLGFPQSFLYIATFDLLLIVLLYLARRKRCGWRELVLRYGGNYLLLLVISLPFLLQLLHEAGQSFGRKNILSWEEYSLYSYRIGAWLNGLLTPFHASGTPLFGELDFVSHVGYLTLFFALLAVLALKSGEFRAERCIFTGLGLFSFLWSADIIVTRLFYLLPFFNKLRYPFKLQFFTGFFLITLSVFGFNLFSQWVRERLGEKVKPLLLALVLLQACSILALYVLLPQRMLSHHLDTPPFEEPLRERLADGRIVSAGPDVVWDGERVAPGHTVPTLGYNFAMLWGLHHFGGYEALLSEKNLQAALGLINNSIFNVAADTPLDFSRDVPLDYLRKWGVRWYVVNRAIPLADTAGLLPVQSDRFRTVLQDPAAHSLVYWEGEPQANGVEYRFTANSLEARTRRDTDGLLVVSVLRHPFFSGYLDGREIPLTETAEGQMVLAIPAGEHQVQLRYSDKNFMLGCMISFSLMAAGAAWLLVRKLLLSRGRS